MAVNRETIRLTQELALIVDDQIGSAVRLMTERWVRAWQLVEVEWRRVTTELAKEVAVGGTPKRSTLRRAENVQHALTSTRDQLNELVKLTRGTLAGNTQFLVLETSKMQARLIASQLPRGSADRIRVEARAGVPNRQLEAIVRRTSQRITSDLRPLSIEATNAVLDQLVLGAARGQNPRRVATQMMQQVNGAFNGGLTRALNVARTELMDGHRTAAQVAQNQHRDVLDGWQWLATLGTRTCPACWSKHGSKHPLAEAGPHGHQQCVLPGAVITGPKAFASTTRWFAGEIVELCTRSGKALAVTPNHPVLTPFGWVLAGELVEGDSVISCLRPDGESLGTVPDDQQVASRIEDLAVSPGRHGKVMSVTVPTTSVDFHGDGVGSEVHVVRTDSELGDRLQASFEEQFGKQDLRFRGSGELSLTGTGEIAAMLTGERHAAQSLVSGFGIAMMLLRSPETRHQPIGRGLIPKRDTLLLERSGQQSPVESEGLGQSVDRLPYRVPGDDLGEFAGETFADGLTRISRRWYSGHVYNLQTVAEWFIANGIVTHNCRCARGPVTKTWAELGINIPETPSIVRDGRSEFDQLPHARQLEIMGPTRLQGLQTGRVDWSELAYLKHNDGWRDAYYATPVQDIAARLNRAG